MFYEGTVYMPSSLGWILECFYLDICSPQPDSSSCGGSVAICPIVLQTTFVLPISLLKVFYQSLICFHTLSWSHRCLVHDAVRITLSWHGTFLPQSLLTVAISCRFTLVGGSIWQDFGIVLGHHTSHVGQAPVAHLYGCSVGNTVKGVPEGQLFIHQPK